MRSCKWSAPLFVTSAILCLLFAQNAYGRRAIGTRASSAYGIPGGQSQWEWTAVATNPVNGIPVTTETVCAGSIDTSATPPACDSTFVFLYQIPSGPNDLVVTFSGLSRFPFITTSSSSNLGLGVLLCVQSSDPQMLCSNLTSDQVASLNIGWDVIDGDLVLTVPSLPAGQNLTFYIAEQPNPQGDVALNLPAPTISLGGAVVAPPSAVFGSQEAHSQANPQTITIANSDDFTTSLDIKSTSISDNFAVDADCSTLAPGSSCPLFIAFDPASTGNLSGDLTVMDDSPSGTEAISLTGVGSTPGVTLSPSSVVFGTQVVGTTSQAVSVTLSNAASDSQSLQVIGIVLGSDPVTGAPDFTQTDNCTAPIAPGSSCTIQIAFTPTLSGLLQSSLTLTDNSPDGTHTILLSGYAAEADTATASPSSLVFGNQTSGTVSAAQTITVANAGTAPVTAVATSATAGFTVTTDNCSNAGPLAAGSTCTVSVAFQPAPGSHAYTGTLTVADDAPGGTLVIPLTGTSLASPAANPAFSPAAGTYTSVQTVTISDTTVGSSIYYTTDGTTPTGSSTAYSTPITVSATQTIKAIAMAPEYTASAIASALYTINLPPPGFGIAGTAVTFPAGASTGNTSTITVTPAGGFTGSVALSATISSSPSNAANPPTLSFGSTSPVTISGATPGTATLTITTVASTVSALRDQVVRRNIWFGAGYTSLAFVMLFGIPRRQQKWRLFSGLLFFLAALISANVGCGGGGGGSQSSGSHTTNPGTTAGAYTITVTGTSGSLSETATVALTIE